MPSQNLPQDMATSRADDYKRLSALAAAVLSIASHQGLHAAPLVIQPGSNASYTFIPAPVASTPASPTPTPPPPSPSPCSVNAASVYNWSTGASACVGDTQTVGAGTSVASGSSVTYTDTIGAVTGSNTMTCTNGVWASTGANCTTAAPPPASCTAPNYIGGNWAVISGTNCFADTQSSPAGTSIAHGGTFTISDTTAPITGTYNYTCNNGTLSQSGAISCVSAPPPAPVSCTVPSKIGVNWTSGASTCTGGSQTVAAGSTIASGSTFTANDVTAPTTGSETYLCTNGAIGVTSTNCTTAAPPPPASCNVPNLNGTSFTGATTCTIDSQSISSGGTVAHGGSFYAYDNGAPSTGNVLYNCNNGALSQGTATCTAPASCTVPNGVGSASWYGSGTCTATAQNLTAFTTAASGSALTYTDNSAPITGSQSLTCNNGSWISSTSSCTTEAYCTTFGWVSGTYNSGAGSASCNGSYVALGINITDVYFENKTTGAISSGLSRYFPAVMGYKTAKDGATKPANNTSKSYCVGKLDWMGNPISSSFYPFDGTNCTMTLNNGGTMVTYSFKPADISAYVSVQEVLNTYEKYRGSTNVTPSQSTSPDQIYYSFSATRIKVNDDGSEYVFATKPMTGYFYKNSPSPQSYVNYYMENANPPGNYNIPLNKP